MYSRRIKALSALAMILVMILTAAMVIPGTAQQKVPWKFIRESDPLDLNAEWEGTLEEYGGETMRVKLTKDQIYFDTGDAGSRFHWRIVDEGNGKFSWWISEPPVLGIYHQEGDQLLMCDIFPGSNQRPKFFEKKKGNSLLILHRVKPRK